MRTRLVGAAFVAALSLTSSAARAEQWCAWYDAYTRTCGFRSFEQCQATAFGAGGFCKIDPMAENTDRLDRDRRRERERAREGRDWR